MRVVIHLERAGLQCFAHTGRNELVGLFLHLAPFLCQAHYLLTLVLFTFLPCDNAQLLHTLE